MGFRYLEAQASKNFELLESLTIGFNGEIYDATDTAIIKLFSASFYFNSWQEWRSQPGISLCLGLETIL